MKNDITRIEFRILIRDGSDYYYILKVEHRESETFCFYPDAGFHFTEHKSGKAHIRTEDDRKKATEGIPIAITTGAAGQPLGNGFRHETPKYLGAGYSITDLLFPLIHYTPNSENTIRVSKNVSLSIKTCFQRIPA